MKKIILLALIAVVLGLGCDKKGSRTKKEETTDKDKPNFTLEALQGNEYTLSKLRGKVVILDFWATWCGPCRKSIPVFNAIYDKYKDKEVLVLGIGLDDKEAIKKFVQTTPINYPVLIGSQEVARTYGIRAIPTTFIIDKEGIVTARHLGLLPNMQSTLEQEIERLINK